MKCSGFFDDDEADVSDWDDGPQRPDFECPEGNLTVGGEFVCDGHPHCSDGADEQDCS